MRSPTASSIHWREPLLAVVAVALGVAIAWVDSRPSWDDTAITAISLLGAAAIIAAVSGRRPLVWAVLVGAWTPMLEIPASGDPASLLALGFAVAGSLIGYGLVRLTPRSGARPPGAPR
ncbi:MAG: hypothetical protein M3R49_00725 [Chloroflexota bacterium]|nr:hypothetical protein [Chloroflexota bacterium]